MTRVSCHEITGWKRPGAGGRPLAQAAQLPLLGEVSVTVLADQINGQEKGLDALDILVNFSVPLSVVNSSVGVRFRGTAATAAAAASLYGEVRLNFSR
eukprot:COSAG01_NODE_4234_length_5218_cov_69.637429_5_plen_98_part_00